MRGKVKYLPSRMLLEIDDLKKEKKISKDSDAFKMLVKYARVGREAERIYRLDFHWKPTPVIKDKRQRYV